MSFACQIDAAYPFRKLYRFIAFVSISEDHDDISVFYKGDGLKLFSCINLYSNTSFFNKL